MKKNLAFDFSIDRESNTIEIKKEYAADQKLVWEAWTTQEWLDKWWGPQPWHVETKTLDFIPNGIWHYAMVGPEGEKHWSLSQFISIDVPNSFIQKGGFCNEEGIMNPDLPQSTWEVTFTPVHEHTLVHSKLTYDTTEDLDIFLQMGFQEGITICLKQLDNLLELKTST